MKLSLILFVAIVSTSSLAVAQGGIIGLFSDSSGVDCTILDTQPGVINVYVVHTNTSAATAAAFAVPVPDCATGLTWLTDSKVFNVTIGLSPTGVSIGYGPCLSSPIHILTIVYLGQGLSEPCCLLTVGPHPATGVCGFVPALCMVDCNLNILPATGASAVINPDHTCTCDMVPVEQRTWGGIKALYRE